jgi:amino acid transporter
MADDGTSERPDLRRVLGLPLLTAYGVGNLVGGGFYALMGKVSGLAGSLAPVAFLVAASIAAFSALSFCELSARYPLSGGPASYVQEVFGRKTLSTGIGGLMIATGTISAATLARAVDGFLQEQWVHSEWMGICVLLAVLAGIAVWGISESVIFAVLITVIEVGGLIYVAAAAGSVDAPLDTPATNLDLLAVSGILTGAFLSFYAFVGFEDLVTLAEEVKKPRQNLPRAILLSLGITTILYVVVATLSLRVLSPADLAESRSPLSAVVHGSGLPGGATLAYVGVLAGVNGALIQIIMGARVIYRLSADSGRMQLLATVNRVTRTPIRATLVIVLLTLGLALWLDLVSLARATSFLLLIVFAAVNLALFVLKRRGDPPPPDVRCYPTWVPVLGLVLCLGFLLVESARMLGVGG